MAGWNVELLAQRGLFERRQRIPFPGWPPVERSRFHHDLDAEDGPRSVRVCWCIPCRVRRVTLDQQPSAGPQYPPPPPNTIWRWTLATGWTPQTPSRYRADGESQPPAVRLIPSIREVGPVDRQDPSVRPALVTVTTPTTIMTRQSDSPWARPDYVPLPVSLDPPEESEQPRMRMHPFSISEAWGLMLRAGHRHKRCSNTESRTWLGECFGENWAEQHQVEIRTWTGGEPEFYCKACHYRCVLVHKLVSHLCEDTHQVRCVMMMPPTEDLPAYQPPSPRSLPEEVSSDEEFSC